jgi:hypothetical protein
MTRAEYLARAHEFAPRGERLPHARLNTELVREIRQNPRGMTARQWAEQLGVHIRTITGVREFRTWRHVA